MSVVVILGCYSQSSLIFFHYLLGDSQILYNSWQYWQSNWRSPG